MLTDAEVDTLVAKSKLVKKYAETIDSESAHEIITAKLEEAAEKTKAAEEAEEQAKEDEPLGLNLFGELIGTVLFEKSGSLG